MRGSVLEVSTSADGSVVIQPHGSVGPDEAVELRQLLVHTVRRVRPLRLIVDLAYVRELDPLNLGSVVAACGLGDDHQVAVFVDNPSGPLAAQLAAAGVPSQRLRLG
jgi:anti-anti-sigma regulatory factor